MTSVICSSLSSKGLPSCLLKNVATPTISSFLLTIGRDRTFLIFHPVSSAASFCRVNGKEHLLDRSTALNVKGKFNFHAALKRAKPPHLKCKVVIVCNVHHVADLEGK